MTGGVESAGLPRLATQRVANFEKWGERCFLRNQACQHSPLLRSFCKPKVDQHFDGARKRLRPSPALKVGDPIVLATQEINGQPPRFKHCKPDPFMTALLPGEFDVGSATDQGGVSWGARIPYALRKQF